MTSMTAAEADRRIILSRQTLATYQRMVAGGEMPSPENLGMMHEEIELLEAISLAHPSKSEKLLRLVVEWSKLRESMMAKLH